ncbi:MAG: Smr/MutS family protein [Pseudomonadota bacterium]
MDENDDEALWRAVVKDVNPIQRDKPVVKSPAKSAEVKKPKKVVERVAAPEKPVQKAPRGKGIDGHIADKLRKGQLEPEAFIDLHGKKQDEAQDLIINFIKVSHVSGRRLVKIITGTGARTKRAHRDNDPYATEPGVLKRRFPEFINHPQIADLVLHFQEAHQKHGGAGAYYVYLRRKDKTLNP